MADNTLQQANETIATDDVGGVKFQRVKQCWGVDGVATDVSAAAPLPVVQTGASTLPTGAATAVNQALEVASLASIDGKLPALVSSRVPVESKLAAATSGGWSTKKIISAATTNLTLAKNSAGQVGGYVLGNLATTARFLKLYDAAATGDVTVGTTVPKLTIIIPGVGTPGAGANVEFTQGVEFSTGIVFALTTGIDDSSTAAVGAGEVAVNLLYK